MVVVVSESKEAQQAVICAESEEALRAIAQN